MPGSKYYEATGREKTFEKKDTIAEHREAIMVMEGLLRESGAMDDIRDLAGIGHRVVHGGESFTSRFLSTIRSLQPFKS